MKLKVLVVDDNPAVGSLVKTILEGCDLEVLVVESGLIALEVATEFNPDYAILDIMMPVMDGHELFKRLRGLEGFEDLPVIFLSAKTGVNNRIMGYQLGAANYLEKPFEIEELRSICHMMGKRLQKRDQQVIRLHSNSREVFIFESKLKLGPIEFLIFEFLLERENMLVTKFSIVEHLSSYKKIKEKNLATHISSLRKKLNPHGLDIESIYGEGVKLVIPLNIAA